MNAQEREAMGNRIREARMIYDWSETDLARKIGVPVSHVQDIEEGVIVMDLETLVRICHALYLWPNYILGVDDTSLENRSLLLN